jgi:hypothetical protein
MNSNDFVSRHENVEFHFLGVKYDHFLHGIVIVRTSEMVLEVQDYDDAYFLSGKAKHSWFEHTRLPGGYDVNARWADVGGTYVGIWIEEGVEYLFSFQLSPAAT